MLPGSQRFANKAFLGLKELQECIYADYLDDKKNKFQYFVINTDDNVTQSIWENLKSKWNSKKQSKTTILIKKIPYQGPVGVMQLKGKIYGVSGYEDEDKMVKKLLNLMN